MKKNYFLLTLGLCLSAGFGYAQNAYVAGQAPVKVESKTLVYFGENLEFTADAVADDVFTNDGYVNIQGEFDNSDATGKNFVSTWTDADNYGQVIIKNSASGALGKLTMMKGTIDTDANAWGQFAVPFRYDDAGEAYSALFGGTYQNGSNRYMRSMMVWNNTIDPAFDDLKDDNDVDSYGYYILNFVYDNPLKTLMDGNSKLDYTGHPANIEYFAAFDAEKYFPGVAWDNWKDETNRHNELYHTYIDDEIRRGGNDDDYGKYIFQYGNPYTSNLDLTAIEADDLDGFSDLMGVTQYFTNEWAEENDSPSGGEVGSTDLYQATRGVNWTGDKEALLIKPFEPFVLTFETNVGSGTLKFSDKIKTFEEMNDFGGAVGGKSMDGNDFYQLKLNLYNDDNAKMSNRVFVAVTPYAVDGVKNRMESEYNHFEGRTGFFLQPEITEVTPDTDADRMLYINTVSPEFVGKPIPLYFNRNGNNLKGYYVKADLFYGSIFNQLEEEAVNFADGNTFLFYDKAEDILLPITTDFSYYIKPSIQSGNNFEVYWNEGPQGEMGVQDLYAGRTIVYKDQDVHKVRFNENWKTADVKVYDVSGRSILTFENVDTKTDLVLKLQSSGVYVVKAVSTEGEVHTQKILKK